MSPSPSTTQVGSATATVSSPQAPLQPVPNHPLRREQTVLFQLPMAGEQEIENAMLQLSSPPPESMLRKQTHQEGEAGHGSDTELDEEGSSTTQSLLASISNMTGSTQRYYTSKKKLHPEQRDEVDTFLLDTALGRQAKLFVCVLALENKLNTIRSAAPPYQLSEELKTNINNYSVAVMLSVSISAYKGNIPRNHVLDILKRYWFDLPVGIKHDYANWEKISTFVGYALTQSHAKLKKVIKESITANTNIFSLAQIIVHSTPCCVTVQLCTCVALMAIHVECSDSEKYWNLIDAHLKFIRSKAGSSAKKIAKAFNKVLSTDHAQFSAEDDYVIGDNVADEFQQLIDNVVAGTAEVV